MLLQISNLSEDFFFPNLISSLSSPKKISYLRLNRYAYCQNVGRWKLALSPTLFLHSFLLIGIKFHKLLLPTEKDLSQRDVDEEVD